MENTVIQRDLFEGNQDAIRTVNLIVFPIIRLASKRIGNPVFLVKTRSNVRFANPELG